ncbi:hypothetical protein LOTGIDRAFT_162816 [Lottia gigantea]|uniref:Serine protease n=1 Tax=Lottia gigantea TaxID=225164 RepID=V4BSV6_LOTGI|nr:hypothetical protein LOTGIDRAFT_162816 [Lottia gigantea]ESO92164.1 hypothetical protein LOTGIDRAFT_162816 [Lottia gigantea]
MARCYHDEQEFKSDVDIEVAREGDILQEGHDLNKFKCHKNPGHSGFIPFKDLTLEDLPEEIRNLETLESIKKWGGYVVRLVVKKIKNRRWVTECGSGFLFKYGSRFCVKTNNHVVKTDDEVKNCSIKFFYDSHDESNVKTGEGVKLEYTCPFRDLSIFSFHPVPDFYQPDLKDPLLSNPTVVIMYNNNRTIPSLARRLWTTQILYYTSVNLNNPQIDLMFISLVDNSYSYLKSSYFKFQPIPSNIQKLTRIEIHIDEDDGNSRVIPGDVVKFSDDYVVKISESLFQDEVKKCRLVWNGEVIAQGTRLYFKKITSRELLGEMTEKEIDVELFMQHSAPNSWLFDFHPQPRGIEQLHEIVKNSTPASNIVCCISHPHGGIKMVTFGRLLRQIPERFDIHGRRIAEPGTDCQCKEISCVKYSCKTCPGSSGCPVLIPNKSFYLITSSIHFLGERKKDWLPDGELIENINTGWS